MDYLRETVKEAGYNVVIREKGKLVLRDKSTGRYELWQLSPNFAGYAIRIGKSLYEFVSGLNHENAPKWLKG